MWHNQTAFDGGVDLTQPGLDSFLGILVISLAILLASAGGIGGGGILVSFPVYYQASPLHSTN